MDNIRVIIKKPQEDAYMTVIKNDLEEFQKRVGGFIETVTICEDLVIICNEEGRIKNLQENCKVIGIDFVGTIIFVGVNGDEFANIPCSYSKFRDLFPNLWGD